MDISKLEEEALAELEEHNNDLQDETETNTDEETNTTEEDTEDDTEGYDDSETEDFEQDGDNDDSDNNNNDGSNDGSDNDDDFEPVVVKKGNFDITLNTKEELDAYNANLNSSKQSIDLRPKGMRAEDAIVQQGGLSADDLRLLVDAKNGNVGAIKQLLNQTKLSLDDIEDFEGDYNQGFKEQEVSPVTEILNNIGSHPELAKEFNSITSNLPQEFTSLLSQNADDLLQFANHVKDGIAQQVLPEAMKVSMIKGIPLADAYNQVGTEMFAEGNQPNATKPKSKSNPVKAPSKREQQLRQRASRNTGKGGGGTKSSITADDIWEMTPEELAKLTPEQLQ